jgi:hypothetical protein
MEVTDQLFSPQPLNTGKQIWGLSGSLGASRLSGKVKNLLPLSEIDPGSSTKPTLAKDVLDVADNTRKFHYRRYFLDTFAKTGGLCELCLQYYCLGLTMIEIWLARKLWSTPTKPNFRKIISVVLQIKFMYRTAGRYMSLCFMNPLSHFMKVIKFTESYQSATHGLHALCLCEMLSAPPHNILSEQDSETLKCCTYQISYFDVVYLEIRDIISANLSAL